MMQTSEQGLATWCLPQYVKLPSGFITLKSNLGFKRKAFDHWSFWSQKVSNAKNSKLDNTL